VCFCSHQGITKRLILLYIFYVLLMTNQNTKNMCLFFLFTNFFRKRFGSKTSKNDSFRQSQSSVNSSQTWVNQEFSKIFWLIITQETPRFMCLFPCLLWQVKNRARAKTVQQESILPIFCAGKSIYQEGKSIYQAGKSIYQLGKSIYQDRILAKTSNFQVLRHLAPIFISWSPKNNSTTTF